MSTRYRLPNKGIKATYKDKRLTLRGWGDCKLLTTGIKFSPLIGPSPIPTFELIGWLQKDFKRPQPYDHSNSFPYNGYPGPYVIVWIAGGYRRVKVEYADPLEEPDAALIKPETEQVPSDIVILPIHETRIVLRGQTFTIRAPAAVSTGGGVALENDPEHIHLDKAGIQGGELVWTLSAVKFGTTEVIVTVAGGQDPTKPPYYRVIYEIHVLWLPSPSSTQDAAAQLSFLAHVNEGLTLIQKEYPDAKLLEVDWKSMFIDQPAKDWGHPGILTVLCSAEDPKTKKFGSVSAESFWNESWSPPKFGPPIIGLDPFALDGLIEPGKALQALRDAGYNEDFKSMSLSLRNLPLPPEQPYYYFYFVDDTVGTVGAKDGKVQVS